jgi:hypothetical protein
MRAPVVRQCLSIPPREHRLPRRTEAIVLDGQVMVNLMHGGSVYSAMAKRTIIFGNAFQYEPSTGDLSAVAEFGGP